MYLSKSVLYKNNIEQEKFSSRLDVKKTVILFIIHMRCERGLSQREVVGLSQKDGVETGLSRRNM